MGVFAREQARSPSPESVGRTIKKPDYFERNRKGRVRDPFRNGLTGSIRPGNVPGPAFSTDHPSLLLDCALKKLTPTMLKSGLPIEGEANRHAEVPPFATGA